MANCENSTTSTLVDAKTKIDPEAFDVLLVPQPSQMGGEEFQNVLAAIKAGVPAAVFEDPVPMTMGVGGTGDARQPQMGPRGMPNQQGPQANIKDLWTALGVSVEGKEGVSDPHAGVMGQRSKARFEPDVVWHKYLPYPKLERIPAANETWVFTPSQQ